MRALGASRTSVAPGGALAGGWTRNPLWKTARAVPSLDLRFADNKTLGDAVGGGSLVTFTRASSGTYVGSDGLIKTATTNEPRFDHNPTTGESLGLLVEEARTNLLTYSEQFDNAIWVKFGSTITANESTAPDGTTTADLWTNTSSPGAVSQNYTKDSTARTYSGSIWVKSSVTAFTLSVDDGTNTNRGRAVFDIATGVLTSVANDGVFTNTSGTITAYPNSWYRVTITTTTSIVTTVRLRAFFSNIGATARIWGAQLEENAAFATSYVPTTTATATRAADVAIITGSNFGTTRTNLVRNNTMVGAVAGSPGTPPTNGWVIVNNATYTSSILGTGVENGINYIDIQYVVAAAASAATLFYADTPAGSASTAYTGSYYFKLVSGTSPQVRFTWQDNVSTYNRTLFDLTSTLTRYTDTLTTAAGATLARLAVGIAASPSGATFVIRVGMPQVELGSVATAVIPTTTAAVSVFESSWYNQTEGTVFADAKVTTVPPATSLSSVFALSDGTTSNRIAVYKRANADTSTRLDVQTSGSSVAFINAGTFGVSNLIAASYRVDDFAISLNGLTPGTDTLGAIPTVSRLNIGNYADSTLPLNGTIKRLTYWPVRLGNNVLQQITQP
jgi:hypothetical protein